MAKKRDYPSYKLLVIAIVAVVGLVVASGINFESKENSASGGSTLSSLELKGKTQDCISSIARPCYDRQTGKKEISISSKGGQKAFEACINSSAPNDNGELMLETAYCKQERFSYCYDGKSSVMLRKFEGKCVSGTIPTRTADCPDYQPVPYHQLYSSLGADFDDLNAAYNSDFQSFLKLAGNERIHKLMQSSKGTLFALGAKYESTASPYASFVPYVYSSADRGKTWKAIALPTTEWYQTVYEYASGIAEDSKGNLYAGGRAALWKSTDSGSSWKQIAIPNYDGFYQNLTPYAIRYVMALKDGSIAINVEFLGQYPFNTYKSSDGGSTWTKLFAMPTYSMAEADDGSLIVSNYDGDVYRFSNNTLTKTLSTTKAAVEHPLLKAADGTIYFITAESAIYTRSWKYLWGYPIVSYASNDNGRTWKRMGEVPDALLGGRILEASDGSIYVGALSRCWGGTVYKLNANSKKWDVVSGSIPYLSSMSDPYLYRIFTLAEIDGKIINAGSFGAIFESP